MKSFSQFLEESYLNEELPAGMDRDTFNRLPAESRRKLSGSDVGIGKQGQTLTPQQTPLAVRSARKPTNTSQSFSHRNPGKLPIPNPPQKPPTGTTTTVPGSTITGQNRQPTQTTSTATPASGGTGGKPPSISKPTSGIPGPVKPVKPKIPGLKSGGALSAALGTADEKMSGSGWARSLAKGATTGAGAVLGGLVGGASGTAIAPGAGTAIGGYAGQAAGAYAADKAFDTVAGANAVTRKAMATANRQSQAGTAIKGIGGKTTFDTKKNTMTTGVGSQRKTVGLAKTGVVQRGGQSVAGHLAYKGGQAVYKAGPSAQSLAKTSSNPLERIGRSLFAGAYKKSDAAAAAKKLATARQSDTARNKALGVKMKPGG